MTIYKKIKIAILLGIYTQTIHAIVFEPVQIQSAAGELLYAEIPFKNSDMSNAINVALASDADLATTGLSQHVPGNLNFYTRRSSNGSGVIVITSSRPIIDTNFNVVIKVQEGNATRIQQIKMPMNKPFQTSSVQNSMSERKLQPQVIVSEKDIALHLPESAQFKQSKRTNDTQNTPLVINTAPPPGLKDNITQQQDFPTNNAIRVNTAPTDQSEATQNKQDTIQSKTSEQKSTNAKNKAEQSQYDEHKNSQKHIVKSSETLWSIAAKISAKSKRNIHEVMREIQENNQHAFIHGDANRLRQGVALNLVASNLPQKRHAQTTQTTKSKFQQSSGATKYRLDQAEMTIVADHQQDAQGQSSQNSANPKASKFSNKIQNMRKQTLNMQDSLTQSELALHQKEVRIKLLNEKLAQLQMQLSKQNKTNKPAKKQA